MANQRVLDDNENDKSTKDGASGQRSHHDDVLGHILEDTSLDEWDIVPDGQQPIAPPDIIAEKIPAPPASVSDIQAILPPEDEWTASEIVPMPEVETAPAAESSLFSFSMMQKFGDLAEQTPNPLATEPLPEPIPAPAEPVPTPVEPIPAPVKPIPTPVEPIPTPVEPIPTPVEPIHTPVEPIPAPGGPATVLAESILPPIEPAATAGPSASIDPLLVPAPPVAIGPNPFLVKVAPIVETTIVPASTSVDTAIVPPATTVEVPATAPTPTQHASIPTPPATHNPSAASTRIPALAPTPAMILAQTHPAAPPTPAANTPTPAPAPASTPASTPAATPVASPIAANFASPQSSTNEAAPAQPKRKPAATLIFDSFTKSKIETSGLDLLNPLNLTANSTTNSAPTAAPTNAPSATPPKQRNTARTLIFKAGMPVDEMDQSLHPHSAPNPDPATTTGANPTINVNPSVGPNLAAAIAAYQANSPAAAATPAAPPAATTAAVPAEAPPYAANRANSNVIPAHNPVTSGRPIARTMILKSLSKPEPDEQSEPLTAPQDGRPSAETIIAAGHAAEAAEAAEAQAAEAGRPKIAKRSTAPTLIFKAFTLPSKDENAKPAPLKIIRYDSSKLRNLETNVKPLGIAESIAAAKQASLKDSDTNDHRPQWLKLITANPLLKSQRFRQAALLIVLSTALLVCAFALVKSLYSDGEDYHPTNVTTSARDQHHFKSTDGRKSFDILDKDKGSVLIHNGKAVHGKIKTVTDADLISLASSPVPKREIWLQKTDAGYVDPEGTTLYSASAPELTIAKKIDSYASILAAKYKETKLYPSDAERFERMSPKDFRFTNPFTGHVDQPSIQYKRFAAAEPSWTDHTQAGHAWADEPPFKPGAIHCVCLDYCRFFMRGFDRNGSPLYGSVPGVADYVELKDGQNMNPRHNDKITDDKDRTPAVFMVARNPALQMEVALLRQIGLLVPAVIIVVALIAGGWILFLRRMKNNKADSLANTTKFTMK